MVSTLFYREATKRDICPDCKGILTHGVLGVKDRVVYSVCFHCGRNLEKVIIRPKKKSKNSLN
jgi:hypothetical protein